MQLQEHKTAFDQAGIAIVGLTYDEPAHQQAFIDKFSITYSMLADIDATTVKALGILNTEYEPGHRAYGIPYPGIFVLRPNGEIAGKIFLEGYTTRVNAEAVLAYALEVLE